LDKKSSFFIECRPKDEEKQCRRAIEIKANESRRTRHVFDEVLVGILLFLAVLTFVVIGVGGSTRSGSRCRQRSSLVAFLSFSLVRWGRNGARSWWVVGGLAIGRCGGCGEGTNKLVVRREEVESSEKVLCAGKEWRGLRGSCKENGRYRGEQQPLVNK